MEPSELTGAKSAFKPVDISKATAFLSSRHYLDNESVELDVDLILALNSNFYKRENPEVRAMIRWILDDKFEKETYSIRENDLFFGMIQKLRESFVSFYFENLSKIEPDKYGELRICDADFLLNQYKLQLKRLRLVIQPEVQIATNKHTQSGIIYLAVKSFWINDNGEKVRKYTKSLGQIKDYKLGIKDPQAIKDGRAKVQGAIYESFKESYPK